MPATIQILCVVHLFPGLCQLGLAILSPHSLVFLSELKSSYFHLEGFYIILGPATFLMSVLLSIAAFLPTASSYLLRYTDPSRVQSEASGLLIWLHPPWSEAHIIDLFVAQVNVSYPCWQDVRVHKRHIMGKCAWRSIEKL